MIEAIVLAASLIVSPPGVRDSFAVPQETMEMCKLTSRLWSLEWRNTEFLCIPNTVAEGKDWYPEVFGPRAKDDPKPSVPVNEAEPKPDGDG